MKMTKRKLRRFRKAGGRTLERLESLGKISSDDRVTLMVKLGDNKEAETICKVCCGVAVNDGLMTKEQVKKGKFRAVGEGGEWLEKCLEFWAKILPMIL